MAITERYGELTRDQYQEHLSLDYARWLGYLGLHHLPHLASKEMLANHPHAVGSAFLKKSVETWDLRQKAAVLPGTSTDSAWAAPLVAIQPMQDAFVAFVRSKSVLGNLPGLRRIPFETPVPTQTSEAAFKWVAQNSPKPLSSLGFSNSIRLGPTKGAAIVAVTLELVKLAVDAMPGALRDDLAAGISKWTDRNLLDPAVAAVAGQQPASITNGVVPTTSTSNLAADVDSLLDALLTARPNAKPVIIANGKNARKIGLMNNGAGVGADVLISEGALTNVIAVDPTAIFCADNGIEISTSREASLNMSDTPDNPATASTVIVSLWQHDMIGYRTERMVNWLATNNGVKYLVAG